MKETMYKPVKGMIVSYKNPCEELLFNEMNARWKGIRLLERGVDTAAFSVENYPAIVTETCDRPPVFLLHLHPFHIMGEITGSFQDQEVISEMFRQLEPYMEKQLPYICQCRIVGKKDFSYQTAEFAQWFLSHVEQKGYSIDPQAARHVISLTLFENHAYLGVSLLEDNISSRAGGVLFFSKTDDLICRAEFKLEEAFQVFQPRLPSTENRPVQALDLGASPGGWTHFLVRRGICVDAVDPAQMDAAVIKNPLVRHYPMTAQAFAKAYPEKKYDIILDDMKMDTNETVDIVVEMSRQLRSGGFAILTLKLPKKQIQKRINVAQKVLKDHFQQVKMKQLYYNRSEVTVFAVK